MTNKEIGALLASATTSVVKIEHQHKSEIQKQPLDAFIKDAKSALLQHKNISLVLVKE